MEASLSSHPQLRLVTNNDSLSGGTSEFWGSGRATESHGLGAEGSLCLGPKRPVLGTAIEGLCFKPSTPRNARIDLKPQM